MAADGSRVAQEFAPVLDGAVGGDQSAGVQCWPLEVPRPATPRNFQQTQVYQDVTGWQWF